MFEYASRSSQREREREHNTHNTQRNPSHAHTHTHTPQQQCTRQDVLFLLFFVTEEKNSERRNRNHDCSKKKQTKRTVRLSEDKHQSKRMRLPTYNDHIRRTHNNAQMHEYDMATSIGLLFSYRKILMFIFHYFKMTVDLDTTMNPVGTTVRTLYEPSPNPV